MLLLSLFRNHVILPVAFPFANRMAARCNWSIQWSASTGTDSEGRRLPGGTCLLWSKTLGKGKSLGSLDPRVCARQWSKCCIGSVYGPAASADVPWFSRSLIPFESLDVPCFLVGDYNWRPCYDNVVPRGWSASDPVVTVIGSRGCPTRAVWPLQWNCAGKPSLVFALPGIPHHCATVWSLPAVQPVSSHPRRLRRCAEFVPAREASAADISALEDRAKILWSSVGCDSPCDPPSIDQALHLWHSVAEQILHHAVSRGLCLLTRKAERHKGSPPSSKPSVVSAVFKTCDSIPMRRCKRLHRAAAEQIRQGNLGSLTPSQRKHWCAALSSGLVPLSITGVPQDQAHAISMANDAIASLQVLADRASKDSWSQKFRSWCLDSIKATKSVLSPTGPPVCATADELLDEWTPQFVHSDSVDRRSRWEHFAVEAGLSAPSSEDSVVPFEIFCFSLATARGAPGLDGWTSPELRFLVLACPWIVRQLYDILQSVVQCACHISQAHVTSDSLPSLCTLFAWRLAAIPKRNSEDSRPVAVGSILLRSFNKVLLGLLPCPPSGQWGGRVGVSVTHATLNWLEHPGSVGAELDLSKAFDLVDWSVAKVSLCWAGAPCPLVDFLSLGWQGLRFCSLLGSLSRSLVPTWSIPQGDPSSPCVLANVLRPWHALIQRRHSQVLCWAYVDDRSLKSCCPFQLNAALATTHDFDSAVGLKENTAKRQLWSVNGGTPVEHLGLLANPLSNQLPSLREGWSPMLEVLPLLARLPGGLVVREAAVRTFFKGKWCWPLPLLESPSADVVIAFRRALLNHSQCNWWCPGRFWADRVGLHPVLSCALGSAMACLRFPGPPSRRLLDAVNHHLDRLGLQIASWSAAAVTVRLRSVGGLLRNLYSLTFRTLILIRLGLFRSIVLRVHTPFGLLPVFKHCLRCAGPVSILKVLLMSTLMPALIKLGPLGVRHCLLSRSFCLLSSGGGPPLPLPDVQICP